ncbi:MAG TPA: hypothetical protein VE974_29405 [Thermoanaerobaculia bacterium]|nr:hypothetical protein [Thermoanaerobaculia bacterium]
MSENESSVIVTIGPVDPSPRTLFLADIVEKTKGAVRSGILHRTPPRASIVLAQDGSGDGPAITQDEWQDALDELSAGVTTAQGQPATSDILDRAAVQREGGHVPIYVAGFDYETVRGRAWVAIERIEQSGTHSALPFEDVTDLVESRRAFLASAVLQRRFAAFLALPHTHYGFDVTFVVPPDALLGTAAGATELTIDFGDGGGARTVRVGEPVDVRYSSFGPKIVTVRLEGDAPRTASFQFVLEESPFETSKCPDLPPVSVYGPIGARITRPGIESARVELGVIRAKGRTTKVTKPVLLVEGFPGKYAWADMWVYANRSNFACQMLDRGHDLISVRFVDGAVRIQANAYALIGAIEWALRERRDPDEKLIVGGFSMGGLVARYTLAFMEHERKTDPTMPDHETARFFTIDSPHEGANLPVSVQALAQAMKPDGEQAKLMRTNAAQQMLLVWVPPEPTWRRNQVYGPSPLREELLAELERVGQMPVKPITIAVANGAGNGKVNQDQPGKLAMEYECSFLEWADLYMYPTGRDAVIFDWRDDYRIATFRTPQHGGRGYDSAPGGVFEAKAQIFQRAYNSVPEWVWSKDNPVKNACFIPTVSALAIPNQTNYFQPVNPKGSRFRKQIHCQEENREHVELTPVIVWFLINHLTME